MKSADKKKRLCQLRVLTATVLTLTTFSAGSLVCADTQKSNWASAIEAADLDENLFTKLYAEAIKEQTGAIVEIVGPLHLHVIHKNKFEGTTYLDNAWTVCKGSPGHRNELLRPYLDAQLGLSQRKTGEDVVDRTRIVPLVRSQAYLEHISAGTKGAKGAMVSRPLGADLYVVYALDLPNGIQLLSETMLKKLALSHNQLAELAQSNLKRILGKKVAIVDQKGVFRFQADGNYESSLVGNSKIWPQMATKVKDKVVMAIPSRDVVLFAGQGDKPAIEAMKSTAGKVFSQGDHVISNSLYCWDGSHWQFYR